jgi:hypothetical protein
VKWVQGLKKWHNVSLDWMGVWNESPFRYAGSVREEMRFIAGYTIPSYTTHHTPHTTHHTLYAILSVATGSSSSVLRWISAFLRLMPGASRSSLQTMLGGARTTRTSPTRMGTFADATPSHGAHVQAYVGGNITGSAVYSRYSLLTVQSTWVETQTQAMGTGRSSTDIIPSRRTLHTTDMRTRG